MGFVHWGVAAAAWKAPELSLTYGGARASVAPVWQLHKNVAEEHEA
jgi:hypothetical protein